MATITKKSSRSTTAKKTTGKAITAKKSTTATGKISYKFPDGTEVTGTLDQLTTIANALGVKLAISGSSVPRGYYPSESKGIVKISDMNDFHIRRALLKRSKDYSAEVFDKGGLS